MSALQNAILKARQAGISGTDEALTNLFLDGAKYEEQHMVKHLIGAINQSADPNKTTALADLKNRIDLALTDKQRITNALIEEPIPEEVII